MTTEMEMMTMPMTIATCSAGTSGVRSPDDGISVTRARGNVLVNAIVMSELQ